jgi:hypothetical protein
MGARMISVTPRPRFTPDERTSRYPVDGRLVDLRAGLDTEAGENILLASAGDQTLVVQSVARHYTG